MHYHQRFEASVNCKEIQRTPFEKIAANFQQQLLIVRKLARIGTVDVTKMQEISSKYRFKRSFFKKPRKDRGFVEIRLHYVCTILYFAVVEKQHFLASFALLVGCLLPRFDIFFLIEEEGKKLD